MDLEYSRYLARTIPPREIARALTVRAKRALGMPAERVRKRAGSAANRPRLESSKIIEVDGDAVLHEAALAKQGTLLLFGQWKSCGNPIDYHRDPLKPDVVYDAKVPGEQVNLFVPGADAKVMWEVGRLTHLWRFAQAREITGDQQWSREWKRELDHFRATNPAGRGVQWSCAMEVSLRASNIAASYSLVGGEVGASDVVASLEEHCDYVSRHLEETGAIRTNHYAADLVGLVVSGALFPELSYWHGAFARRLWDEIPRQVRRDGTHFESSTGYHRLCAEMFWLAAESSRAAGKPPPAAVDRAIAGLFESLGKLLKPNGNIPQIGDLESCHALPVTPRSALDTRYFKNVVPSKLSERLDDAGIAVLRAGDAYLCMSSGPNGQGGTGGHAHNDKNSVDRAEPHQSGPPLRAARSIERAHRGGRPRLRHRRARGLLAVGRPAAQPSRLVDAGRRGSPRRIDRSRRACVRVALLHSAHASGDPQGFARRGRAPARARRRSALPGSLPATPSASPARARSWKCSLPYPQRSPL
jgi:hypothetical protein